MKQAATSSEDDTGNDVRARIVEAAATLLARNGARAVTTRAVAQAAGVQPPTIYRNFGDKEGLLDAVAEAVFTDYVGRKTVTDPDVDPVQQLRDGFDRHVAFGLAHPAVFVLISAPQDGRMSRVMRHGLSVLAGKVRLAARAGHLKVAEEKAAALIHAAGTGTVLMLLHVAPEARDELAVAAREAVLASVLSDAPPPRDLAPAVLAATLRTRVGQISQLTPGERGLMEELLARIASAASARPADT